MCSQYIFYEPTGMCAFGRNAYVSIWTLANFSKTDTPDHLFTVEGIEVEERKITEGRE